MTQRELFDKLQTEITDQLSDVKLDLETSIAHGSCAIIDQLIMETQITRDVIGNSRLMLKTKHFDFIVDSFEDKVGSGMHIFSRVWYIDQCRTHVKARVYFTKTGNIEVRICQGRNPFVMGLTPVDEGSVEVKCYLKNDQFCNKVVNLAFTESSTRYGDCWNIGTGELLGEMSCNEIINGGYLTDSGHLVLVFEITIN